MKSTIISIREIAQKFLEEKRINFLSIGEPKFQQISETIDIPHWTVPYEYKIFEIEDAFIEIDDATHNIFYVLTKHGRRYINGGGAFAPEQVKEEDEDNWDDI
jgi:hypothetical protein